MYYKSLQYLYYRYGFLMFEFLEFIVHDMSGIIKN